MIFVRKIAAATFNDRRRFDAHSNEPLLFPHGIVKFLPGVMHVLSCRLEVIQFLLLRRRQHGPNFCHRPFNHGLRFLHCFLMNGNDLGPGLVNDRLNLGLLVGREVQSPGQMFDAKSMTLTLPTATAATAAFSALTLLRLGQDKAAQNDGADCCDCEYVSFHNFRFINWLIVLSPNCSEVFHQS